ncbi:hypothetical protein BGZ99_004263 [Dissophora globulifera]|uniref:SGNH hydrolase-type esterase domain-containing protein n=1 Tax=Dissophora globulifera TaxID=979702 RepID=A0A9P6RJ80_9FUNG|nr:hypothetical protein BGZ99_004263 [Dissophora globulifera]
MQAPEPARDSALRRRTANQRDTSPDRTAPPTDTPPAPPKAPGSPSSPTRDDPPTDDGKVYYNGQTYHGTGRLPRDAPFTPTYINAYTFNSAVAFISLVVTATFFYFKIIVGILESPQVGPDREFLPSMSSMGPTHLGELRPLISPVCPLSDQIQEQGDEDCALFGKIVVLADSISKYGYTHATQGWLGFLADEWSGRADVVLRGFPGYNTHWVKAIFPDLHLQESTSASSPPVRLVIIALGTDDAAFPHTRQHISLSNYKDNLKSLITSVRYPESPNYSPDTQIILVTPAPVDDIMWEASLTAVQQTMDRSNNVTKEYADACAEVGEELHVPVVNLWKDIQCQLDGTCELHESDQLQDYLMDGLHLRRMGNEVLYKGVLNTVATHFPHLHPTCWPPVFPGYSSESSSDQSVLNRHCSRNHRRRDHPHN